MAAKATDIFAFPKLRGPNYAEWKVDMRMALAAKGLDKFVDSNNTPPGDATALAAFNEKKSKTLGFLYLSLERDIKRLIGEATDPAVAWKQLKDTYEPSTRARIAMLREKFVTTRIESGEKLECFLCRVEDAAAQLNASGKVVADDEVAFQMISKLPMTYDGVVQSIYQWPDKDFTTSKVKMALTAEAGRIEARDGPSGKKDDVLTAIHQMGNKKVHHKNMTKRKETRKCYNCGIVGHLIAECRKPKEGPTKQIVSKKYPPRRGQRDAYDVMAVNATEHDHIDDNEWVWDSAAGSHLCNDESWFSELKRIKTIKMRSYFGEFNVTAIGTVAFTHNSVNGQRTTLLRNVCYAPNGRRKLISGFRVDEAGYHWQGGNKTITVTNGRNEDVMIFKGSQGLYRLYARRDTNSTQDTRVKSEREVDCKHESNTVDNSNQLEIWHRRLGHCNTRKIAEMSKSGSVRDIPKLSFKAEHCDVCNETKMVKLPRKPFIETPAKDILERIHSDVWGPSSYESGQGSKYFVTFVDEFTRWTEVYTMTGKWEVLEKFQQYVAKIERKTGKKIKTLRTDNGMEYCSKKMEAYLMDKGIKHERTNTYTPTQNGMAERYNRTALQAIRAMLKDAGLPSYFWAELLHTFNYIKNRLPRKALNEKTPFEMRYGRAPSMKHLRRVGAKAHVFVPKETRNNKFADTALKGVMIGYAYKTRGYRIWVPGENKVYERDNVKFDEASNMVYADKSGEWFVLPEDEEDEQREITNTPPKATQRKEIPTVGPDEEKDPKHHGYEISYENY